MRWRPTKRQIAGTRKPRKSKDCLTWMTWIILSVEPWNVNVYGHAACHVTSHAVYMLGLFRLRGCRTWQRRSQYSTADIRSCSKSLAGLPGEVSQVMISLSASWIHSAWRHCHAVNLKCLSAGNKFINPSSLYESMPGYPQSLMIHLLLVLALNPIWLTRFSTF